MSKTTRFVPALVAAVLVLSSLSSTAQASTITGTDTAAVAAVAQSQPNIQATVDRAPRTQEQACDIAEWPFEVTCDIYNSDDPRLVVAVYIWTPFGYEKAEEWTFRADGRECVSGFGHEFCAIVDFDWEQGCVTGTLTFDGEPIWGPETWCWSEKR
ncbi:hypothetical protein [Actinophytocola gossypii]|uniref:Uncharacterized protein n=1 Tax=Actinophytocola gossypii TaxID=2812003 RepID=A0ABT2J1D8_9PSEU|nr:hypothetical protein [Actinophytocola gossypii]MCT2581678.1 hypothetical protein [Actinophytocola gossypii]